MNEFVELFLQTVVAGVLTGCIYGLMCIGLAFIFGIMRVVNFAQGDLMMIGMYAAIYLAALVLPATALGAALPVAAALLVGPVLFVVGSGRKDCLAAWRSPVAEIVLIAAILLAWGALTFVFTNPYYRLVLTIVPIWATFAVAWNVFSGYSGQLSVRPCRVLRPGRVHGGTRPAALQPHAAAWHPARLRHRCGGRGGDRVRYAPPESPSASGSTQTSVQLQADLDSWMTSYNEQRPHQGRWCYGKTPMQTFFDSKTIAREKTLSAA